MVKKLKNCRWGELFGPGFCAIALPCCLATGYAPRVDCRRLVRIPLRHSDPERIRSSGGRGPASHPPNR